MRKLCQCDKCSLANQPTWSELLITAKYSTDVGRNAYVKKSNMYMYQVYMYVSRVCEWKSYYLKNFFSLLNFYPFSFELHMIICPEVISCKLAFNNHLHVNYGACLLSVIIMLFFESQQNISLFNFSLQANLLYVHKPLIHVHTYTPDTCTCSLVLPILYVCTL